MAHPIIYAMERYIKIKSKSVLKRNGIQDFKQKLNEIFWRFSNGASESYGAVGAVGAVIKM